MNRLLAPGVGARAFAAAIVGLAAARSAWASADGATRPQKPATSASGAGPVPWPTTESPGNETPPPAPAPPAAPAGRKPPPAAPAKAAPVGAPEAASAAPAKAAPAAPAKAAPVVAAPGAPVAPAPSAAAPPAPSAFPTAPSGAATPPVVPAPAPPPIAQQRPAETSVGAYGEALVQMDRDHGVKARVPSLVLTFQHRPVSWFQLVAAVELEEVSHIGFEQLQLQLTPHPAFNVRAGLILLPIDIINLWHEPTTFLTVDRPLTDRLIIPTTWRELGAGIFGALGTDARYEVQVVAGLDAAGFSAAAPLWGGRGNGATLGAHDAALVGRLEIGRTPNGFAVGGGGYWGGASGGHAQLSDVTVGLLEADARFHGGGFDLRAELAEFFIVNSYRVNDYLGLLGQDAVPSRGRGFYAQAGYDVLAAADPATREELVFFAGFENVNPRSRMSPYNYNPPTITGPGGTPPNAPSPAQSFVRGGVCYRPIPALAFKADVQVALDAEGAAPAPLNTAAGAPGTPKALPGYVTEAARGKTLVSAALAFLF